MKDDALPIVIAMCVRFEGFSAQPYACAAGVATIGHGATRYIDGRAVRLTDPPLTREQAMTLLRASIERQYMPQVITLCPGIDTPARLAAITDFAFNCGTNALRASTLRRRINDGQWDDVPAQLMRWVFAAGKRLRGLERRRAAEAALI